MARKEETTAATGTANYAERNPSKTPGSTASGLTTSLSAPPRRTTRTPTTRRSNPLGCPSPPAGAGGALQGPPGSTHQPLGDSHGSDHALLGRQRGRRPGSRLVLVRLEPVR